MSTSSSHVGFAHSAFIQAFPGSHLSNYVYWENPASCHQSQGFISELRAQFCHSRRRQTSNSLPAIYRDRLHATQVLEHPQPPEKSSSGNPDQLRTLHNEYRANLPSRAGVGDRGFPTALFQVFRPIALAWAQISGTAAVAVRGIPIREVA